MVWHWDKLPKEAVYHHPLDQYGLVEAAPADGRGLDLDGSLRSLPMQTILKFN